MSTTKNELRTMADQAISKSYLGILRVAHIKESVDGQEDSFLNPYYYGIPQELMDLSGGTYTATEIGYQSAGRAFNGELNRYINDDSFKNRIIPITDSTGNYLNWNAGEIAFTIGSNENINGNSRDTMDFKYADEMGDQQYALKEDVIFPILTSANIFVGLSPMLSVDSEYKSQLKQKHVLTITASQTGIAPQLIINNFFDRSSEVKATDENGNVLSPIVDNFGNEFYYQNYERKSTDDKVYRTILRDTKDSIQGYDGFIYHQDNYDYHNYHKPLHNGQVVQGEKYVDAIVDVENIVEYVKKKIELFNAGHVVEVPTGTVIWQHCSLDKWYGTETTSGNSSTATPIGRYVPTNNPPMQRQWIDDDQKTIQGNVLGYSTIQGVSKGGNHIISAPSMSEAPDSFFTIECTETQPIYKRDYALCDGSEYTIYFYRKLGETISTQQHFFRSVQENNLSESYDRFINLFFSIGYQYTPLTTSETWTKLFDDNDKLISNISYTFSKKNFEGVTPISHQRWNNELDRNVVFGSDLASIVTYKLIAKMRAATSEKVIENNTYSYTKTKEWLSAGEEFNSDFIFNSFIDWRNEEVIALFENNQLSDAAREEMNRISGGDVQNHKWIIETDYSNPSFMNKPDGDEQLKARLLLGREVNNYNSLILWYKFEYDSNKNEHIARYWIYTLHELPRLDIMLRMMEEIKTSAAEKTYFAEKYNIQFRVPNFLNDQSGSLMGSSFYAYSDEKESLTKTSSWSPVVGSELPHRHYTYLGYPEAIVNEAPMNMVYLMSGNQVASNFADFGSTGAPEQDNNITWRNYMISTCKSVYLNGDSDEIHESATIDNFFQLKTYHNTSDDNWFNDHFIHRNSDNQIMGFTHSTQYIQKDSLEPNRCPTSGPIAPNNSEYPQHDYSDFNYFINGEQFYASKQVKASGTSSTNGWDSSRRAEIFVPMTISMLPLIKL